jgi:hypothetical protein
MKAGDVRPFRSEMRRLGLEKASSRALSRERLRAWAPRFALALVLVVATTGVAAAADVTVAAGQELTLDGDVTLAGADNFSAGDDTGAPCQIHGAGHGIVSAPGWTGSFGLHNCLVDGLGNADLFAIQLQAIGAAALAISGTTFSASAAIEVSLADQSTMVFRRNVITANSLVPAVNLFGDSAPVFHAQGFSTGAKVFQGNLIQKSRLFFENTSGWTVGGDQAGDGNVLAGTRAGIDIGKSSDILVEGNYSHTSIPMQGWNQVKNLTMNGDNIRVLHNVFWGYNWSTSIDGTGEVAYNLIVDNIERGYGEIWNQAGAKIHHNLLVATRDNTASPRGGFVIESHFTAGAPYSTEIYNNTFDAGGVCVPGIESGVLIKGGVLGSLRSNLFAEIRVGGAAKGIIHSDVDPPVDAGQALYELLGYTDYNLFYAPDSPVQEIHGVAVVGKAVGDPGAGQHDTLMGGNKDQLTVPLFTQKIPRQFAFPEATVIAGTTSVCQILAYYRQIYTPAARSVLLGGGDPADGADNFIGAIGDGTSGPSDLFGRASFCDPNDIGQPDTAKDIYTCTHVPIAAGTGVVKTTHGFQCVCALGPADSEGAFGGALGLGALALAGCATRRRRRL